MYISLYKAKIEHPAIIPAQSVRNGRGILQQEDTQDNRRVFYALYY